MPPEYRTRALVLRTFDQGESDRLVHLYTESLGRVSAIAKGARRSKKRFPGTLEIFSQLEVRLVDPPRAQLMRLEGARLASPFEPLTADLGRYAIGCMFCELLDRLTGEHEANPEMYRFAVGVLGVLGDETPDRLLAALLLAKTLARLGYLPQLVRCARCGEELPKTGLLVGFDAREGGAICGDCGSREAAEVSVELLRALDAGIRTPLRDRHQLGLSPEGVARLDHLLDRFFRFHVGFELRSDPFLRLSLSRARLDLNDSPGDTAPARASCDSGGSGAQTGPSTSDVGRSPPTSA